MKRQRKRSVKRRSRRVSKRRQRKGSGYDGAYKAKCHFRKPLVVDAGGSSASMGIHWGSSGVSGVNDMYIDDSPEFANLI